MTYSISQLFKVRQYLFTSVMYFKTKIYSPNNNHNQNLVQSQSKK